MSVKGSIWRVTKFVKNGTKLFLDIGLEVWSPNMEPLLFKSWRKWSIDVTPFFQFSWKLQTCIVKISFSQFKDWKYLNATGFWNYRKNVNFTTIIWAYLAVLLSCSLFQLLLLFSQNWDSPILRVKILWHLNIFNLKKWDKWDLNKLTCT